MEGVAGIVDWSQCRAPGQPYEEGRALLLGEVNAAIDGALAGGAISRFAALQLHPEEAREKIYAAAETAARRAGSIAPPAIALPARLDVETQTADIAEVACWVKGVERSGIRSVRIEADDPVAAYEAFISVTYITRVAEGR